MGRYLQPLLGLGVGVALLVGPPATAQGPRGSGMPAGQNTSVVPVSPAGAPLFSIRPRRPEENVDIRQPVAVTIESTPGGAWVSVGRKSLGQTPVTLSARSDTPLDITIRMGGYMTLHTRVSRRMIGRRQSKERTYHFVLAPAKF